MAQRSRRRTKDSAENETSRESTRARRGEKKSTRGRSRAGAKSKDATAVSKVAPKKDSSRSRKKAAPKTEHSTSRGSRKRGAETGTTGHHGKGHDKKRGGAKGGADKKRRRGVSLSLMVKFTLPVALVVAAMIGLLAFFLSRQTSETILNEMLKDGTTSVTMLSRTGRQIIRASETGNMLWPVDLQLITREEFFAAANMPDPGKDATLEYDAPIMDTIALKIGVLHDFIQRPTGAQGNGATQILAAYITSNRPPLTGMIASSLRLDPNMSKVEVVKRSSFTMDPHNFLPTYAQDISKYRIGIGKPISFKSNDNRISVSPMKLTTTVGGKEVDQNILLFSAPVLDFNGSEMGKAYLGINAESILTETRRLYNLLWMTGGIAVALSVLTCVIIGYTVSKPAKMLIRDMAIVAEGDLEHRTRARSGDEIGQIAAEFNDMTHKLYQASLKEKEQARLENELEMACEIQMKLLPPRLPAVKGFDMHAVYRPAKEVGGDYYDFFPIDKTRMGIIVADVSGKGIPGSMVMATTRTILRFIAAGNISAADTLSKTNAMVAMDIKRGMFVTAFYMVLDAKEKTLLCSSAGHNPMVLHRADGSLEMINPNGIALGFDKGAIFTRTIKEESLQLGVGDRVVLYTDGVVEAMNAKSEEYTDERFCAFIKKAKKLNSEQFIKALLKDLDAHKGRAEQHDDITIVTFRVE